jgi:hypothetical protein
MSGDAMSPFMAKIFDWILENHPDEWVRIGGVHLQCARGLPRRGLAQIRKRPTGGHEIRLTERGRKYRETRQHRDDARR